MNNIPNINSVFEGLSEYCEHEYEDFTIQIYKQNEFKLKLDELNVLNDLEFWYILEFDGENPKIGDEFMLRLMILPNNSKNYSQKKINEIRNILKDKAILPKSKNEEKDWWEWVSIWVGDKYELIDLSEKDISGLANLLDSGLSKTLEPLKVFLREYYNNTIK